MVRLRQVLRCVVPASAVLALGMAAPGTARAQGKLEARYTASLAGIPIGTGSWTIDIGDSHYSAAASGVTTGLMRVFTGGQGRSSSNGTLNGKPSSAYAATITTRKKTDEVRFTIANGSVKELKLDPPADDDPERLPVTEAHRRGVLDPMSAMLLHAPANGDMLSPEVCQRTLAVFDGRLRYDLQLAFKRMDKVKAEQGYSGLAVVCAVYFSPVAGYIPSRSAIKYVAKLRDMEIWLAPVAGTRVLVPFRFSVPTPFGLGLLQANYFIAQPQPTQAAHPMPVNAKTQ